MNVDTTSVILVFLYEVYALCKLLTCWGGYKIRQRKTELLNACIGPLLKVIPHLLLSTEKSIRFWWILTFEYISSVFNICWNQTGNAWYMNIPPNMILNSLWPSDDIWRHRIWSTLAQVMACCLMAPSHYLKQFWPIISKVQSHSSGNHFTKDTSAINHWDQFENYFSKFSFKSPRGQWVNPSGASALWYGTRLCTIVSSDLSACYCVESSAYTQWWLQSYTQPHRYVFVDF